MDFTSTIMTAAKAAHVSGALLLAICGHESNNFTQTYAAHDGGSPSFGVCQVKKDTAKMLGFDISAKELMKPETNARVAAQYLKYQTTRYEGDLCKAVAAYNAGSYLESTKSPGYPKNLKYVRMVQKHLTPELSKHLSCGGKK